MAVRQLSDGGTDGTVLGQDADDKIAFHGATPTDKPALIADASVAHALNATFSDTEVEAALDALGTKINSILDILEEKGLMASS